MITVDVLYSVAGLATQILLSHRSSDLLVDAGDGVVRDLVERRYDFYRLKGILLTHEDFDHISGLYALLNCMKNYYRHRSARSEELAVFVPKPVHHAHLMLSPPLMYSPHGFPVKLQEAVDGQVFSIADFTVRPFEVAHGKTGRGGNLGYSVTDEEDFKVVLSGDTRPCKTLVREAEGADIAVLEATGGDHELEKMVTQGHMTESEAREIGQKAKRAIYIHQAPAWFV